MSDVPANKPIVLAIGRNLNRIDLKLANPEASPEEVKAAWQENRADYMKKGRRLLTALEKQGFTITAPGNVSGEG
ncbi:hypothetical protein JQU17_19785 [Ponticoccus sp. SC2-23]|jgi:hypothetical protein|uniref:hypothetical protein n=1 Tax=Alexandriicola marinus TaxID=2081710 RepID=UPI000FDC1241|nr:hypothetical protein [Alexandriicola marinus]MBM1222455.1 hypothetical protein [Ponticoccus sp. SC6-9]MBM1226961.1 hypothetical protein [Ponticoccus sp. SC6-15]MBM1231382.1 hypothetical protein [Ponticoccus sp. SC6-38]MBM1235955.1 hypothetical protein [Ponticoccus sp. SC6-45]MBM1240405.1 hypothetical protein [Ponticoccus sp. SC6-49]MBM1244940.1 hypothetical protein [Ponticoccus sp. SC2-64]MBM1249429.1 hypothetical protein [Ponticoccus sp. SC6-42]MBM1253898.1 hypothetical protein [Pontico